MAPGKRGTHRAEKEIIVTTRARVLIAAIVVLMPFAVACDDSPTRVEPPGRECGGFAGLPCPVAQTCELPAGECETADLSGTCVPIPEGCITVYLPVCGCDGQTYGNDCERIRARVQKRHDGECG